MRDAACPTARAPTADGSGATPVVELETRVITSCDVRADVGSVVSKRRDAVAVDVEPGDAHRLGRRPAAEW